MQPFMNGESTDINYIQWRSLSLQNDSTTILCLNAILKIPLVHPNFIICLGNDILLLTKASSISMSSLEPNVPKEGILLLHICVSAS